MQTNLFDQFPDFILQDTRKNRAWSPVTSESLFNRHQTTLPADLIKDKSILDLGSCLSATGHWCLSNGASHYTGVEVQPALASKGNMLLSKHWDSNQFEIINNDILEFLKSNTQKFDIIVLVGVIYAFVDHYSLLEKISSICNEIMIVDCIYPRGYNNPDAPMIQLVKDQAINSDIENTSYVGIGARISPAGLRLIMSSLGFEDTEGFLIPKPASSSIHDPYSTIWPTDKFPNRFLLRFYKTQKSKFKLLQDIISKDDRDNALTFDHKQLPNIPSSPKWQFDESVANRFQREAENHIPDYSRVINLCIDYTKASFNTKDIKIIDVGSALGFTVDKFINNGYNSTYGVDSSSAMVANSLHTEKITLSNDLPLGPWDVVLANWTMHFVDDRESYFNTIYEQLTENGLFIISDKMSFSKETKQLYHNFKLLQGVSIKEIEEKERSLVGVLISKPLSWYLDTLKQIGFRDIQVINSRFMFNTICARK